MRAGLPRPYLGEGGKQEHISHGELQPPGLGGPGELWGAGGGVCRAPRVRGSDRMSWNWQPSNRNAG